MATKVLKKTKDRKQSHIDKIPKLLNSNEYLCLIENTNLSSSLIKRMRTEIPNTTILCIKKGIFVQKYKFLKNENKNYFLAFTNQNGINLLKEYQYETYFTSGDICIEDVIIKKEQISNKELIELIQSSIRESTVEKTSVKKSINLDEDYTVCTKGDVLSDYQCKILRLMKKKLKMVHVNVFGVYESKEVN